LRTTTIHENCPEADHVNEMNDKPSWEIGEKSPWAGQRNRPSVFEVGRAYPGRAFGYLFGAAIVGIPVGGFLTGFLNWTVEAGISFYVLWPIAAIACCWFGLYGDIRGWWTLHRVISSTAGGVFGPEGDRDTEVHARPAGC
jgi:hypothetical protein